MTLLEHAVQLFQAEALRFKMEIGQCAESRIQCMSNYELLELISQALEAKQEEV